MCKRSPILIAAFLSLVLGNSLSVLAQDKSRYSGPIIDVHLHGGYKAGSFATEADGITPLRRPCKPEPCFRAPAAVEKAEDILPMTLKAMREYNIVLGVLSDQPSVPASDEWIYDDWKAADPNRFIFGYVILKPTDIAIDDIRELVKEGQIQVIGELGFQYSGIAIDDPLLDPYFELAEELDIPVHVHLLGGGGTPDFPIHLGNPLRLSPVLQKHPDLRIHLENAGWPFLEEVTALMYQYPNVYADLSTVTWLRPRDVFHEYLRGLVRNGLSKRLMFGSDQMMWPETIGLAVEAIESADFLTDQQKRDIFYNNAARFLRLSEEEIARHHGK